MYPHPYGVGPADTIGHGKPRPGDEGMIKGAGKTRMVAGVVRLSVMPYGQV